MHYTDGQPLHVCKGCGFVQVLNRRTPKDIARAWENSDPGSPIYAADLASVDARHAYVARLIDQNLDIESICDFGAGDGAFLEVMRDRFEVRNVLGVSPAWNDCNAMLKKGIECFHGLAEDCDKIGFDIVSLLWTLENTGSCRKTLAAAYNVTGENGHVIVATGSRILVPFKKPLHAYLGTAPLDLHPWRFSYNTLCHLMVSVGFDPIFSNKYRDSEYLVIIGKKGESVFGPLDDYREVKRFFSRWHLATKTHYA